MSFSDNRATTGRWGADDGPALAPYVPPRLRTRPAKLVSSTELEQGYETVSAEGVSERREYDVLAHVVADPERPARDPAPRESRADDAPDSR
jgi:hypothetical protein